MFDGILGLFSREPALFVALGNALVVLAVSFGLPLSVEQKGAIDALITVLAGLVIRSQVVPVAKVAALVGPAEIAPPAAT